MLRQMAQRLWLSLILAAVLAGTGVGCSSSETTSEDGDELASLEGEDVPDLDSASVDDAPAADADLDLPPEGQIADAGGADASLEAPASAAPVEAAAGDPAPVDLGADPAQAQASADPAAMPATDPNAPTVAQSSPEAASSMAAEPVVAETAAPANTAQTESYTVQPGDTLMKIAFESTGDLFNWRKLYELNRDKVSDPNNIAVGTVLTIERGAGVQIARNGEKYAIKPGDTLGKISDDVYGTPGKWRQLWENNRELIRDPNKIFAGFFLYYTMTPAEREEADRLKQGRISQQPLAEAPAPAPVEQYPTEQPMDLSGAPAQASAPAEMAPDARAPASADPAAAMAPAPEAAPVQ